MTNISANRSNKKNILKDLIDLTKHYSLSKYLIMIILNFFGHAFYLISFSIPRKKNIWVFGSWSGKRFSDNSKYLFLYIANNHKTEVTPIWISKDRNIVQKLRNNKFNAYYAYDPKGIYYNLRAKYVFSDHLFDSVNFWCCGGATKIQLWHGVGPKKIEHDLKNMPWNKPLIRLVYLYFAPWLFMKNSYVIVPSYFFADIFASAFRIKKENVLITGLPRNDSMFNCITDADILDTSIYIKIAKIKTNCSNSKLILYMPTFRGNLTHANDTFIDMNFDFEKLNSYLDQINGFFIIKLHPLINTNHIGNNYERIIVLPSHFDVYPLLAQMDILITDYSSIYMDFLLLNKPIIFIPYDLEKYLKDDRELYFNYQEYTPGPKALTFEDLLYWIDHFIKDNNKFKEQREKIRNLSFNYIDGESSSRIYNFIYNL